MVLNLFSRYYLDFKRDILDSCKGKNSITKRSLSQRGETSIKHTLLKPKINLAHKSFKFIT